MALAQLLSCLPTQTYVALSTSMCSFVDIERRDKTVHPDGSEEVEVTPYNKVFMGEVRAALLLMEEHLGWRVWPEQTTLWCYMRLSSCS